MRLTSFAKKFVAGTTLCAVMVLGLAFVSPVPVSAADNDCPAEDVSVKDAGIGGGASCARPDDSASSLFGGDDGVFQTITNIMLFLIGAISVIMLIVGGIMYVLSGGEQSKVTSAKNTILYAIIGIVVAFLAYAAVGFVTDQLRLGTDTE